MAKITTVDGSVIEGSVEELKQMADLFGVKKAEGEDGYRKVVDRSARVGDFIKYDEKPADWVEITLGQYYEIKRIDSFDDPQIVDDEGDEYDTSGDTFGVYEKVIVQDCCEECPKNESLKVGDCAKVISADYSTMKGFESGEIVKVIGEDDEDYYVAKLEDESMTGFILKSPSFITKATDEDLEKATKCARWSAIGRKPNEYKRGDIVCVTANSPGGSGHKIGTIGEILTFENREVARVSGGVGGWLNPQEHVELITPVEQRFDRKDSE